MALTRDFRGQILKSRISGMGVPIYIEQKGWVSVIYDHDRDHLVTKVGCKDLPDSDRSDFRCWCAVDSSSCELYLLL